MTQVAFLFPGQGSQAPGMGKSYFDQFPIAKQTFEEASDSISLDLKKLCFDSSEQDLSLTENTQPALLTVSTAVSRVLNSEFDLVPAITAGHSIGEYAALVAAGSLNFSDAVKAVRLRGQAMQAAVPVGVGGMTAVMGLDPEEVIRFCELVNSELKGPQISPANFNCPGQIVISGHLKALDFARTQFNLADNFPGRRIKMIPLTVSAPFHCPLMEPAEMVMKSFLNEISFKNASIPVIQNLTALVHQLGPEIKENLIRQVTGPVKWMQSMDHLKHRGLSTAIEVGHGKVVAGLLKKINPDISVLGTTLTEDLQHIENLIKQ